MIESCQTNEQLIRKRYNENPTEITEEIINSFSLRNSSQCSCFRRKNLNKKGKTMSFLQSPISQTTSFKSQASFGLLIQFYFHYLKISSFKEKLFGKEQEQNHLNRKRIKKKKEETRWKLFLLFLIFSLFSSLNNFLKKKKVVPLVKIKLKKIPFLFTTCELHSEAWGPNYVLLRYQ